MDTDTLETIARELKLIRWALFRLTKHEAIGGLYDKCDVCDLPGYDPIHEV